MRIAKHLDALFILHVRIGHVHLFHHRLYLSVLVVQMGHCIGLLVLQELFDVLSFSERSELFAQSLMFPLLLELIIDVHFLVQIDGVKLLEVPEHVVRLESFFIPPRLL